MTPPRNEPAGGEAESPLASVGGGGVGAGALYELFHHHPHDSIQ